MARQLYYPFRTLRSRTNKKIRPIFFTLSNDVYSFFIYDVVDMNNYNSLQLVKQVNFMFNHKSIIKDDLSNLYKNANEVPEPLVPFPQADSFERVIDLLNLLVEKDLMFEEITLNYDFSSRQTGYYTNAGIYLGLIEKFTDKDNEIAYRITKK
ncbi:translation elongation factor, partial [Staphylococcus aureus]|nr:translation elongation factor [Staphylococcus aureus]